MENRRSPGRRPAHIAARNASRGDFLRNPGMRFGGPIHRGLADRQLAAATDYRRAEMALGPRLLRVVQWCVLGGGSVLGYAQAHRTDRRRAYGYLLAALHRLADHYENA